MIYCVEDDGNIRELIVYTLESTGFQAKGFENGTEFRQALEDHLPELVLLDIMLPNEDGMDILKELRKSVKTRQIPVIMVTAKSSEYDKVIGLDSGADDYITKPFGMMELVSRIKAVLRRANQKEHDADTMQLGNLILDIQKHEVIVEGEKVALTLKEFELLRYLLKNENVVLTRQQLLEKIWGYDFTGETRTVDVHIRTLRQKLGSAGKYIDTVRGVGYRIGEKHDA